MADVHSDKKAPSFNDGISVHKAGSLEYIGEQGGNGSLPTYQEASGAPVEVSSPLGYEVAWLTLAFLNVGQTIGVGVFSSPASILKGTGSVGLSMIFWVIGSIISAAGIAVYLELAAYFPSRSGGPTVFLEQAFPRPRWLFPVAFAVQSVILSFSSSNAIVMANYIYKIAKHEPSAWELKGLAIGCYSVAVILMILSNRASLAIQNIIGGIKVLTLVFISITGLVVLGGHTKVPPTNNFKNAFEGTTSSGFFLANALVNITYSYMGWENAFNVLAEVKDPIRTVRRAAPLTLALITILYILCNVAYFATIPKAEILSSTQVTASIFFTKVFGARAAQGLTILPVLSAFGNLISVLVGQSRMIREIGRQGVLPYPKFWVSTRPFGTPLGPLLLKWGMTILMIVAPPAGDAFNFIVSLQNYPDSFFLLLAAVGVFLIRRQRKVAGIPRGEFYAWTPAILFFIAAKVFLLVMPWVPPPGGIYAGNVSFFYATSLLVGIGVLALCGVYYYFWISVIPKWKGYRIRQSILELPSGEVGKLLVRVPLEQLDDWDATHDAQGRKAVDGLDSRGSV